MKVSWYRVLSLAAVCSLGPAAGAVGPPPPTEVGKIVSARLGETREYWVSLPDAYRDGTTRYPVVYMMDGELNFSSATIGGLRLAAQLGDVPDFIVVGIPNTDRGRDVFPEVVTYGDGSKDGGRGNEYLDFIREELIPRVETTYRTSGYRVLFGTSNTGFTTVYALFRSPSIANAFVASSATLSVPSFREKRESLVKEFRGGKRRLSLVMGERDLPTVISQNGALKELIDTAAPAGLSCRLAVVRGAEHVPVDSLAAGLRDVFDGWRITVPLTEETFSELRAHAEGRLAKFGVAGDVPEGALKDLADSLLAEKKTAKAAEVLEYRARAYPAATEAPHFRAR
ncbi:MAG: alpha/beta hydrolase [Thermoanaerobaculia bacterium]